VKMTGVEPALLSDPEDSGAAPAAFISGSDTSFVRTRARNGRRRSPK